jgi:hypothetical protein
MLLADATGEMLEAGMDRHERARVETRFAGEDLAYSRSFPPAPPKKAGAT